MYSLEALLFLAGYILLAISGSAVITVIGSFCIGFANGMGIPCIIAFASKKAGRDAGTTVMPMLSASMYLSQFASPFIMSVVTIDSTLASMGSGVCGAIFRAAGAREMQAGAAL